ncbi:MAG: ERCC4 domain-containing protein [Fuerstiella sp.]
MKLPAEPKHHQCRVVVDTREQLPYVLEPLTVETGTLSTGDYGLAGEFSGLLCIERKSLQDFISSCTTGRERFNRELQRMLSYPCRAVVVEASWQDVEAGEWRAKATPATISGSITSFVSRGVPVMLCGDRAGGERFTGGLLWRCWIHEYRRIRQLAAGIDQ